MKKLSVASLLAASLLSANAQDLGKNGYVMSKSTFPTCKFFSIVNTSTDKLSVVKYIDQYNPKARQTVVGEFENPSQLEILYDVDASRFSTVIVIATNMSLGDAATLTSALCYEAE